jgi:hypothetical protein
MQSDVPTDVVHPTVLVTSLKEFSSLCKVFQSHQYTPNLKGNVFAGLQWEVALIHLQHTAL